MTFSASFFAKSIEAIQTINYDIVEKMADVLSSVRANNGRLFIIGSGGGAGHASHAVCDFRKLCNFESYAPYDNVSELTARVNDDGWESTILEWLKVSKYNSNDCVFVFSVGGGNEEEAVSTNIVQVLKYTKEIGASIIGVASKDGGFLKKTGDAVLIVPTIDSSYITPITEGIQSLVWHLLVSHPKLVINSPVW